MCLDYVRIPFFIEPDFVRKRYSYIEPDQDKIVAFRNRIQQSRSDESLPTNLAMSGLDPYNGTPRASRVAKLFKEYNIQEGFVTNVSSKLDTLSENLGRIRDKGYDYIFGVLERIAHFSKEHAQVHRTL